VALFSEKVHVNEVVLVRVGDGVLHVSVKAVTLNVGLVSVDPEADSDSDKEQLIVFEKVGVALSERRKERDSVGVGVVDPVKE